MRPFIITRLSSLGKKARKDLEIVAEFPMHAGDVYALDGSTNSRFGHCVPVDASVTELRVSYVFRCVSKDFVHPDKGYYHEVGGNYLQLPEIEAGPDKETAASDNEDGDRPIASGSGHASVVNHS